MNETTSMSNMVEQLHSVMDSGKQYHVTCKGRRWVFDKNILDEAGVEIGDEVSDHMIMTMMQDSINQIRNSIAILVEQRQSARVDGNGG